MGILINTSDFKGRWKLAENCYSELAFFVNKYEKQFIQDLLGCDLADLFIADLVDQLPVTQRFIDIYEPFCKDEHGCIYRSEGMKDMLLGMIYFMFIRDLSTRPTTSGVKINVVEVAKRAEFGVHDIYSRWNEAIDTFDTIQWFICDNATDYPEENGIQLSKVGKI